MDKSNMPTSPLEFAWHAMDDASMMCCRKNAMRDMVEHHGVDNHYPPIRVVIVDGNKNEDVVIKVTDEGGGIPKSHDGEIQRA
eukprot:489209-Ditylum_brightwellii.AAC.1